MSPSTSAPRWVEGPHWDADVTVAVVRRPDRGHRVQIRPRRPDASRRSRSARRSVPYCLAVPVGSCSPFVTGSRVASESGEGFELKVPVELENNGNRMNDAKCDPVGRLFAGTTAFDFATGAGALYRIDLDWSCGGGGPRSHDVERNGVEPRREPDVLHRLRHVRPSTCSTTTSRPAPSATDSRLVTIDAGGRHPGRDDGGRRGQPLGGVLRWRRGPLLLARGRAGRRDRLSRRARSPVARSEDPTASELYVTSARYRMTPEQLTEEPLAGATFVCRPGVVGIPASCFAG